MTDKERKFLSMGIGYLRERRHRKAYAFLNLITGVNVSRVIKNCSTELTAAHIFSKRSSAPVVTGRKISKKDIVVLYKGNRARRKMCKILSKRNRDNDF